MKHWLIGLSLILGIFFVAPMSVGHARNRDGPHPGPHPGGSSVPELDPSTAGSALVLLLGGVAYVLSRRRDEDLA